MAQLLEGTFLKRYKRFFADFSMDGNTFTAHVPNTGSMKSCNQPGAKCLVSPSDNPERKLKYTLEAVQAETGSWVGVNTSRPNQLVRQAFTDKIFPHWKKFNSISAEVKINPETRIDFLLEGDGAKRYVEVKNVTFAALKNNKLCAQFPDAVTERGQKHLAELMTLMSKGFEAEIFFVVQRTDCDVFSTADEIDPDYGVLFRNAIAKGLIVSIYTVDISNQGFHFTGKSLKLQL
jgi:sugar fermentation stimulation protein A